MMNMFWESLDFEVPAHAGRRWGRAIDTFAPSPHDIASVGQEPAFAGSSCTVQGRSIVVLVSG
jgi:glycogen operon protein